MVPIIVCGETLHVVLIIPWSETLHVVHGIVIHKGIHKALLNLFFPVFPRFISSPCTGETGLLHFLSVSLGYLVLFVFFPQEERV